MLDKNVMKKLNRQAFLFAVLHSVILINLSFDLIWIK
ncbi:hypothetical protein UACE39S_00572 [Ureibacillus acetophenoni]